MVLICYPIVEQMDQRKRASAESVLALLLSERPELPQPRLGWFGEPVNRDYRQMPKASYILESRPMDGICYPKTSEIWIKATASGGRLVEIAAHEYFHYAQPLAKGASEAEDREHEAAATAYGLKVAALLCPKAGLFLKEERHALPGDSTLMKHGDRQWARSLDVDGCWAWHRPLGQFELYVSSTPIYR